MKSLFRLLLVLFLLPVACTKLYQPTGPGVIPDVRNLQEELKRDVYALAEDIGERNHFQPAA
ncbi:MAG: hypothetical protein ACI4XO_02760, partial [Akkermansia sp.]